MLKKIRNKAPISDIDKSTLSKYIFVFFKRVLAAFDRLQHNAPKIAKDARDIMDRYISDCEANYPDKAELYASFRKKVQKKTNELEENLSKGDWARSIPHSNGNPQKLLSLMTWTFYLCGGLDFFITGDNPVFFHSSIGMGRWYSDLSFPISKDISLLVSWHNRRDRQYLEATSQEVKELNRMMAFNVTRFLYSPIEKDWVRDLLNKKEHKVQLWASLSPWELLRPPLPGFEGTSKRRA